MTGLIMSALQVRLLLQTHRRRDSCHSFKVDRAVATDLTSDDSPTLHPPSEAASRARDPPHPVLALHLVRSTGVLLKLSLAVPHFHARGIQGFLRVLLCLNLVPRRYQAA